ncbi:hypothetical protein B0H10DRAFT_2029190, partial [Mycena sp. CBHHK59/15]
MALIGWRPSSNNTDIIRQDSNGVNVAFYRPTHTVCTKSATYTSFARPTPVL